MSSLLRAGLDEEDPGFPMESEGEGEGNGEIRAYRKQTLPGECG